MRTAVILVALLSACAPISKRAFTKKFTALENKLQDHTGFILYDLDNKKELYSFQANQYFTPASNTKTFTLYTALTVLGDSVPALRYVERNDSLIIAGTGDPSFLYENLYDNRKTYLFLSTSNKKIFLTENNFYTQPLGRGWAWDDLPFTYSVERSALPLYGNYLTLQQSGTMLKATPAYFALNISVKDSVEKPYIEREASSNKINFYPTKIKDNAYKQWKTSYKTGPDVTAALLTDTLKKKVIVLHKPLEGEIKTLYSVASDSLYKAMMQESDNFIAEQLLLVCANVLSDSLQPEIAIRYMKKNHLADLPDEPRWVDGSGLSRYNLFTPRSMVKLWEKLYEAVPQQRLFPLLAIGGKTGTVKNYYKNDPPYLYGKTGTLTNNHSVSGFLVTRSGRTFIFSFMNNNHPATAAAVRTEMENLLKEIYLEY